MPKPELLDPQGKAVAGALTRLGHTGLEGVRIGKRIEVSLDHPVTDADLDAIKAIAADVFSNPIIEDVVSVRAGTADTNPGAAATATADQGQR